PGDGAGTVRGSGRPAGAHRMIGRTFPANWSIPPRACETSPTVDVQVDRSAADRTTMTLTRPALLLRGLLPLLAALVAVVGLPVSAAHASAAITGLRVLDVTHSSFTVRLDSQGAGWKYRLFAGSSN